MGCVTITKRTQNPMFWPLVTPRHAPWAKYFASLYFTLHYLSFDTQHDYGRIKCILDSSGPHPSVYLKIPNVFLQSSSIGLSPVKISTFKLKWSRSIGVTLQTYVRTDGRGVSQYPRFFFEKRGDKCILHFKMTWCNSMPVCLFALIFTAQSIH